MDLEYLSKQATTDELFKDISETGYNFYGSNDDFNRLVSYCQGFSRLSDIGDAQAQHQLEYFWSEYLQPIRINIFMSPPSCFWKLLSFFKLSRKKDRYELIQERLVKIERALLGIK